LAFSILLPSSPLGDRLSAPPVRPQEALLWQKRPASIDVAFAVPQRQPLLWSR
jgi:hypothetical protein